jgi:hypothetical protein
MKTYIIENLTPILIGFAVGILSCYFIDIIHDIIIKIALINNK